MKCGVIDCIGNITKKRAINTSAHKSFIYNDIAKSVPNQVTTKTMPNLIAIM